MDEGSFVRNQASRQQNPEPNSMITRADPPSILSCSYLRYIASWIRDDLDVLIAREGPLALSPDDVLTIHSVLIAMQDYNVPVKILRTSRIHLAVTDMCGKATRWPKKLADEADSVAEHWDRMFGRSVKGIRLPLFEPGGRLWDICEPGDITRESMMRRFLSVNSSLADASWAHKHGSLGFEPGQWWINGMFAYRDGIIGSDETNGGICANADGAYAIVMKGNDESRAQSFHSFTYSCGAFDRGRYRMTSANYAARQPIRVLRSHDLTSAWAPRVGLRYDGLHKIVGWSCHPVPDEDGPRLQYDIHLEYDDKQPISDILRRPLAEEADDFAEYQTVCEEERDLEREGAQALSHRSRGFRWSSLQEGAEPSLKQRKESAFGRSKMSTSDYDKPVSHKAAKMNIPNIKKDIDEANALAGFGLATPICMEEAETDQLASLSALSHLTKTISRQSRQSWNTRSSGESSSEAIGVDRFQANRDFDIACAGPAQRKMLMKMQPFTGGQSQSSNRPQTPSASRRIDTRLIAGSMDGSAESEDVSPCTAPQTRRKVQPQVAGSGSEWRLSSYDDDNASTSGLPLSETESDGSPTLERRLAEARRNALASPRSPIAPGQEKARWSWSGRRVKDPGELSTLTAHVTVADGDYLTTESSRGSPRRDSGHQNLSAAGRRAAARGAFEVARSKAAMPENAEEFLIAQRGVWHELGGADYVDRQVLRL